EGFIEGARDRARGKGARRARRARLHRGRPHQDDGEARTRAGAGRGALPGADGAAPRHRILFALIFRRHRQAKRPPDGRPFRFRMELNYAEAPSFTARPFSLSRLCNSPAWNISRMMSQPPTNSPFT